MTCLCSVMRLLKWHIFSVPMSTLALSICLCDVYFALCAYNVHANAQRAPHFTYLLQIAEAMVYLHSKNILFRDLKPGNVLVWEFPLPLEQWNPDTTVLVKLADYGISKQISPQGIHSKVGTAQYLPPEVLLHSEHEAASLRVDVYSFAMVIYYLFAFKNPFDNSVLVGSQLRSGRRPELLMKVETCIQIPNTHSTVTWYWEESGSHKELFNAH